jgi:hypothetical protein
METPVTTSTKEFVDVSELFYRNEDYSLLGDDAA